MSNWTPVDDAKLLDRRDRRLVARAIFSLRMLSTAVDTLPDRLPVLRDQLAGQPGASSYDGPVVTGGRAIIWCDRHERDVTGCHHAGEPCDGVSIRVSDPTGEAAMASDPARRDRALIERYTSAIGHNTELLVDVLSHYQHRGAPPVDRRVAHDNEPGCESCARLPGHEPGTKLWMPPHKPSRTTVAGNLAKPMLLCQWCKDWVRGEGRLPNPHELGLHHDGRRVVRPSMRDTEHSSRKWA